MGLRRGPEKVKSTGFYRFSHFWFRLLTLLDATAAQGVAGTG